MILEHVEEWQFHTGERILHPFVTVMEVRDGKIVRWHDYSNIGNVIDHAPQWWLERIAQGYAAVGHVASRADGARGRRQPRTLPLRAARRRPSRRLHRVPRARRRARLPAHGDHRAQAGRGLRGATLVQGALDDVRRRGSADRGRVPVRGPVRARSIPSTPTSWPDDRGGGGLTRRPDHADAWPTRACWRPGPRAGPSAGWCRIPRCCTPAHATELVRADGRPQPDVPRPAAHDPVVAQRVVGRVGVAAGRRSSSGLAVWWGNPIGYVLAFLLMGRTQAQLAALMHEAAHRLLFANRRAERLRRPVVPRLPDVHVDRRVPARPHGAPPSGVRARRARHPALRRVSDQHRELPPQAGARRDRADRRQAVPRRSSPGSARPTPACGARCGRSWRCRPCCSAAAIAGGVLVGLPRVLGRAVPHRLARHQPAPLDRRARRHGRVARSAGHHAHRPAVVVGPLACSCRSTSAGTSPTTSTPACRCGTCPSTTGRCCDAGYVTADARVSRAIGRCGGRCARGTPRITRCEYVR